MYITYVRMTPAVCLYMPLIAFAIRNKVPSMATGKTATPNTTINE